MNYYDSPSLLWDSGALWDDLSSPEQKVIRMSKVKLGLRDLNATETVGLSNTIQTAMTGNPNFPTSNPPLGDVDLATTELTDKIAAYDLAQAAAQTALSERDAAWAKVRNLLTQLGTYVENASGGDKIKIESAGMGVRSDATPVGIPAQVTSLVATAGEFDGSLDAAWAPVYGAASYEIETSVDPVTLSSWTFKQTSPKSSASLNSFTSGTRIWLRVRAVGAAGVGPWSDPAVKTVP